MRKYLFLVIVCLCAILSFLYIKYIGSGNKIEEDFIVKLNNGYVCMDARKVIHWKGNCHHIAKNMLIQKRIGELSENLVFCSCVPVDKMNLIKSEKEEIDRSKNYFANGKYLFSVNGEDYTLSSDSINKYGIDYYISSYPNMTIRMQNDYEEDYDIPLREYKRAVSSGLVPYRMD